MKNIYPMLFSTLKDYTKTQFIKDLVSGIIVAIIALPLSIALGLASGVGPEQGIYTAIIAGFIISLMGGSHVQISGPTAAFATIVASIVAKNGMDGLIVATMLAGIILIIMGLCRFGSLIKFIPFTITTGFTSGIAVTIVIGQLKDFFGMTYPVGMSTIETTEKLKAFFMSMDTLNMDAVLVGLICLAVLIISPKITEKIPGSLLAVIAGILVVKLLPLQVNTIGDLYTISNRLPSIHIPHVNLDIIRTALPDGITIAILVAIESLLSCVVADGMIGEKHRSNTELVAQGAGNIASVLFGGIPATGAIARTAANIKNGGRTPVAGIVHALVLMLILVSLMPYAALIPMPTIAAILFMVAYNMCQWRTFLKLVKTSPKSDVAVLVITSILTVIFDLVVAIEIGMLIACVLFMKRMSDETVLRRWKYIDEFEDEKEAEEIGQLRHIEPCVRVYEITGPLFFGAADLIEKIIIKDTTKCLILRMQSVPSLDSTALNALAAIYGECAKKEVSLIFSHVNDQPLRAMQKAGFVDMVGYQNFCKNIDEAIRYAEGLIEK